MANYTILGQLLEVEMSKKCTPLRREADLEIKRGKTNRSRTTFGSCDVEKMHAVVARSTFGSEHVQIIRGSDHFWTSRCRPDLEKVHALAVSSTFPSQKYEKLQVSRLF